MTNKHDKYQQRKYNIKPTTTKGRANSNCFCSSLIVSYISHHPLMPFSGFFSLMLERTGKPRSSKFFSLIIVLFYHHKLWQELIMTITNLSQIMKVHISTWFQDWVIYVHINIHVIVLIKWFGPRQYPINTSHFWKEKKEWRKLMHLD